MGFGGFGGGFGGGGGSEKKDPRNALGEVADLPQQGRPSEDFQATALADLLRTSNASLEDLDLGSNGIEGSGALALGEMLRENATLRSLDLLSKR